VSIVLLLALLRLGCAQILLNPPRDASVITVDVDLVNVLCQENHGSDYRRRTTASLVNLETASKAAQQSDAAVYGIHYEDGSRS
jgi:hypothetical protein